MDIAQYMRTVGQQARAASRDIARADSNRKNSALRAIATAIRRESAKLLAANQEDVEAARAAGLEPAMLDRLTLSEKSVEAMAEGAVALERDGRIRFHNGPFARLLGVPATDLGGQPFETFVDVADRAGLPTERWLAAAGLSRCPPTSLQDCRRTTRLRPTNSVAASARSLPRRDSSGINAWTG